MTEDDDDDEFWCNNRSEVKKDQKESKPEVEHDLKLTSEK
jgi:hypothetical protein